MNKTILASFVFPWTSRGVFLGANVTQFKSSCTCISNISFKASSKTQGQLVGTIKCSCWKFTIRLRRDPGHLLLPNQFQKRLNCLLLIFFWPVSEEEQPGDSGVFLHDVVFLIDRHCWVARSTGIVSRGKFQNKMLTRPEKLQALARQQEINTLRWIFTADLSMVS